MKKFWLVRDSDWGRGDLTLMADSAEDAARAAMAHTKFMAQRGQPSLGTDGKDRGEDLRNLSGLWLVFPLEPDFSIFENYTMTALSQGEVTELPFRLGEAVGVRL